MDIATKDTIVQSLFRFELLTRLPRTGFLMRGVDRPETIAEHSYLAALLACLLMPELKNEKPELDGEKLLSMLLLHESSEILVGDIPAPAGRLLGPGGKARLEAEAGSAVLHDHEQALEVLMEFEASINLEAKIARSLDKLQMMIKVLIYESEGRGRLDEFWAYGGNMPRCGLKCVDSFFDSLAEMRGKVSLDYLGMVK